jgi:transposase
LRAKAGANLRPGHTIRRAIQRPEQPLKKFPRKVRALARLARIKGLQLRVMFQDEARFGHINEPRRCWAPRGIRPDVPAQLVREYTYTYAAACPLDGGLDSLILPEVGHQAMAMFLRELGRRHPDKLIALFMDQAGWHKALALRVPDNVHICFLPPYSPQLNPVEHVWDELREKWFENLVFDSLDAVEDRLEEAVRALEHDSIRIHSLTAFDWIICDSMIAT